MSIPVKIQNTYEWRLPKLSWKRCEWKILWPLGEFIKFSIVERQNPDTENQTIGRPHMGQLTSIHQQSLESPAHSQHDVRYGIYLISYLAYPRQQAQESFPEENTIA